MEIELPWIAPTKHPLTKLKKPTVALLNWTEEISESSIRQIGGQCPGPKLLEIQQKLRALAQEHREHDSSGGV
jgi:hypothetical protein